MKIKLIGQSDDFVVHEIIQDIRFAKKGPYAFYRLEKSGYDTAKALEAAAKRVRADVTAFAHGGRKHREAKASQVVSFLGRSFQDLEKANLALKFLGYWDRPMGPDLVIGNHFHIVVRDLKDRELSQACERLASLEAVGIPNYFDDGRFGTYDPDQGFLAEKLIKEHYNGAVKIYLTASSPDEPVVDQDRKKKFFELWKKWDECFHLGVGREKEYFHYLKRNPSDFVGFLQQIPADDLSLHIAAYQGYLWNLMLRSALKERHVNLSLSEKGVAGDYGFYETLSDEGKGLLEQTIPLPGSKPQFQNDFALKIYETLLREHGITRTMFNIRKIRQAFFKAFDRKVIVKPQNLKAQDEPDGLYPNSKKLTLDFTLPRASYGTMVLKRLFADSM